MSITKQYSINFNSQTATAVNPSTFNNKYTTTLYNPLGAPLEAKSCKVGMVAAQVWNYDTNILAPNNKLYYKPNAIDPETSLTIPNGYYGLSELQTQISLQLEIAGYAPDLFIITGDTATQKVVVRFTYVDTYLNFTPTDSIFEILGFTNRYSPATAPGVPSVAGGVDIANNVAQFNSVNGFLIQLPNLVNDGIPTNSLGTSVIGLIPTIAAPNSLISYSPEQVIWVQADHLIGSKIFQLEFEITNELIEPVTVLDPFNFTITIEWTE